MSKPKKAKSVLRVFSYIKHFYYLFIPAIILVTIVSVMNVMPVAIIDQLTSLLDGEQATTEIDTEEQPKDPLNQLRQSMDIRGCVDQFVNVDEDITYFIVIIVVGVIVAITKFIAFYLSTFFVDYMGRKIVFQIRKDLFSTVIYLPLKYFERSRIGRIISITNNDVLIVQDFAGQLIMTFIKELFTIIFIVGYMLLINPVLTLVLFVIGPLAVLLTGLIGRSIRRVEKTIREKFSDITNLLVEILNNIPVVKSYAMEGRERKEFIRESRDFLSKEKKFIRTKAVNTPFLELIGFMAVLGVLAIGGYQILTGGLVLGDLVTFATSLALISAPIQNVSKGFLYIKQASASADRIFSLMDEEVETNDDRDKPDMHHIQGDISFEDVCFSYSGKAEDNVLNGINLSIKEKETLAIVGLSGGGKTTLVKLIPILIKPTAGRLLIDGKDTSIYNLKSIRKQISMVTQDIMLFHGSIADNILYGKPNATKDDIIEASKIANAYDFIMSLPDRFSTQIGEKGVRLSGGQKQRIALARALIRKPHILILDEATSSLDTESERAIQSAFMKINHQQTTIVIAHRLSTIINSDRIIVVEEGRITEEGSHKQLLEKGGTYKRLYDLQFKMPNHE